MIDGVIAMTVAIEKIDHHEVWLNNVHPAQVRGER
jgi:hypothetical protein